MREKIDRYLRYIIVFSFISIYLENRVSCLLAKRERFSPLQFLIHIHNHHNSASGCIHMQFGLHCECQSCSSYDLLAVRYRGRLAKTLRKPSSRFFARLHAQLRIASRHSRVQRAHALFRREAHYIRRDRSTL